MQPWSIGCLWVLLTAMALWRMLLSTGIGGNLSTAVITWRQLEGLLAYVAVGVLLISEPGMIAPVSLGRRRVAGILAGLLALAAVLAGAAQAMLESEMNGSGSNAPEILGFLGDALLALCGIFMAFRELKRILGRIGGKGTSDAPGGLTLLDLWRFAAVQWGLLMVAAMVYLRVRVSPEDAAGNEEIRRLLFFLPAAGALPNAMMAGGIAAWDWIVRRNDLRPAPPRLRAWPGRRAITGRVAFDTAAGAAGASGCRICPSRDRALRGGFSGGGPEDDWRKNHPGGVGADGDRNRRGDAGPNS